MNKTLRRSDGYVKDFVSDFIAVDLGAPLPEFIMDMERSGERLQVHVKGVWGFQPLELIKGFWGRG